MDNIFYRLKVKGVLVFVVVWFFFVLALFYSGSGTFLAVVSAGGDSFLSEDGSDSGSGTAFYLPINAMNREETVLLKDLSIGDRVVDTSWQWEFRSGNGYTPGNDDELRPVTWIVAAKEHSGFAESEGTVTLVAAEGIARYPFDSVNSSYCWLSSELRSFLRNDFYGAFSRSFQDKVSIAVIPFWDGDNKDYIAYDRVFVPSFYEFGQVTGLAVYDKGVVFEVFRESLDIDKTIFQFFWTRTVLRDRFNNEKVMHLAGRTGSTPSWNHVGVIPALNMHDDVAVYAEPVAEGVYEIVSDYPLPAGQSAVPVLTTRSMTIKDGNVTAVNVSGKADSNAFIEVSGGFAALDCRADGDGYFSIDVPLKVGKTNKLQLKARLRGERSSEPAALTFKYDISSKPIDDDSAVILPKVERPVWQQRVLRWQKVDNATAYEAILYKDGFILQKEKIASSKNRWDIYDVLAGLPAEERDGSYTAFVRALGDNVKWYNGLLSERSEPYVHRTEPLGQVSSLRWADLIMSWEKDINAVAYELTIYKDSEQNQIAAGRVGGSNNFFNAEKLVESHGEGLYSFTVRALGDNFSWLDGPVSLISEAVDSNEADRVSYGFVLGDDTITVSDAITVLRYIVNLVELDEDTVKKARVTALDGDVTVNDAIAILRYIVGLIEEFPVQKGDFLT